MEKSLDEAKKQTRIAEENQSRQKKLERSAANATWQAEESQRIRRVQRAADAKAAREELEWEEEEQVAREAKEVLLKEKQYIAARTLDKNLEKIRSILHSNANNPERAKDEFGEFCLENWGTGEQCLFDEKHIYIEYLQMLTQHAVQFPKHRKLVREFLDAFELNISDHKDIRALEARAVEAESREKLEAGLQKQEQTRLALLPYALHSSRFMKCGGCQYDGQMGLLSNHLTEHAKKILLCIGLLPALGLSAVILIWVFGGKGSSDGTFKVFLVSVVGLLVTWNYFPRNYRNYIYECPICKQHDQNKLTASIFDFS